MFGATVTHRRRTAGAQDRYGNPTYTWTETPMSGVAFAPGGSVEPSEVGRASVVTTPKLYSRAPVDVTVHDEFVVGGATYTVQGEPAVWVNPWTAATAGTVVELERVDG
jgi:hypothetical protein